MAWRMISPLDLHESIPPDIPDPSPGKRRRSTGRKKSSKSESEHDVPIAETVQEQAEIEQGWLSGLSSLLFFRSRFDPSKIMSDKRCPYLTLS